MDILVYAHWKDLPQPQQMGTLSVSRTRGRSVFAFAYHPDWLTHPYAQSLDPDLQLFSGAQYLADAKPNFGLFLDSAPDRWGRVLMDRREALTAKVEGRPARKLFEEDYLLGVYDAHRIGGLRFKSAPDGPFLNDDRGHAAPPWVQLRELEAASLRLEDGALRDEESLRWINLLLAPGASLGGARPKASVRDESGALWMAKFPSVKDATDVGAWEMVAASLAARAGIAMSESRIQAFNSAHRTFLTKRFDREGDTRLHFASAMTLLGRQDGEEGASYLDLVEFIQRQGADVRADLDALFRRVVFNIAVCNTDDHLRNHGFLLTPKGWKLSPAYDINPVYHGTGLNLAISETDNSLDFELARSVARYFRITDREALDIIAHTKEVREHWRDHAARLGIARSEQELMSQAFAAG